MVNKDEITEALHGHGIGLLDQVQAVLLESNGSMTIVPKNGVDKMDTLKEVESRTDGRRGANR